MSALKLGTLNCESRQQVYNRGQRGKGGSITKRLL